METPLLQTKLYIPPRPELIPRPRLIERLNEDVIFGAESLGLLSPIGEADAATSNSPSPT